KIDEAAVLEAMGLAGSYRTVALLDAVAARDTGEALKIFAGLWQNGKAADTLLGELSALLRDSLVSTVLAGENLLSGNFDDATLNHFSEILGRAELLDDLRLIQAALAELRGSQSPKTLAELCLIRLCEPELRPDCGALLARVEKLEADSANNDCRARRPRRAVSETTPELDPVSEPTPVPDPEPEGTRAAEAVAPAIPSNPDFWPALLAALHGKLKIGDYNILTDPVLTAGELSGDSLTIAATNFARRRLSAEETEALLKDTAAKLLGRTITLRFEERSRERAQPSEKLDALSKFDNVQVID
ncbi:MAG: hypothetical protein FWC62_05530, partial [Firmicutes bacterium]|nr:hypothetical protein [Bacillota bacterium]